MYFANRLDAGRQLAERCLEVRDERPVIVGLSRGGVPVAAEVAERLGAPLDVLVARKLGSPGNPEYAIGALAEGGGLYLSEEGRSQPAVYDAELDAQIRRESRVLEERARLYRARFEAIPVSGRTVMIIDDGIATGATIRAALASVLRRGAARVIVASPIVAADTARALRRRGVEVFSVKESEYFLAVGQWYRDFPQVPDEEVVAALEHARRRPTSSAPGAAREEPHPPAAQIEISDELVTLEGLLAVPERAKGIVLFVHGSGSSRWSPRNQFVASRLHEAGFATLLMDLLSAEEEESDEASAALRFDIHLLARRVSLATQWVEHDARTATLPVGYFGASTGAAAALVAAASHPRTVKAVVSRGGRPDLAEPDFLRAVRAPTLLIVGQRDTEVLELNRQALRHLEVESELMVVPGATHLFEEPGTLAIAAAVAAAWFEERLHPGELAAHP